MHFIMTTWNRKVGVFFPLLKFIIRKKFSIALRPTYSFHFRHFNQLFSEMSVRLLFRISSCHPSVSSCEHLISTKNIIHFCPTQVWLMTHWLGFTKVKSCLNNLIYFYHKVTYLERTKRRHWKYFFWIMLLIHIILLDKLLNCGISRFTVCWVKNWLEGRAWRGEGSGAASGWCWVTSGAPLGSVLEFNILI